MTTIREDIVFAACHRAIAFLDYNIQDTRDKQFDFLRRTVLADKSWFDESKFHLCISNKHSHIVQCYGLTKKTLDGNYMLVLFKLNNNLKEYLQQNYNKLTWEKRIQIIGDIVLNYLNENNELTNTITDTNNFQIISDYSISSSSINTFNFSSRIYEFKDLPEPRNATKEEQEAYHSVQLDYDLREDNLMIIIDNKANNESKRIYLNEDEKDISITDNSKKKLKTSKNDEIYNPKLHSDENSFDKTLGTNFCNNHSLDKMDLNYMLN
ncbi:kinase-like domain-containing protein [Rhizophagus clarus]|uniref:Kinase-like domain-containing protein n=1 Tax=Rhizophagus clarus TaxID=94130 RepID=A0A8H3L1X6_9GLOM|nr:kinase-like domain-containing protein [Rhizophagus clarus]